VLDALRDYVLHPEIVEGAIKGALDMLRPQVDAVDARRRELMTRLRELEAETARLTAAVAQGGKLTSLMQALTDREQQRSDLDVQLASLDGLRNMSRFDVRRIERELRARVRDWKALLRRQTPIAREVLSKLVGEERIVFTPQADQTWTFEGRATLGALLQGVVLPLGWRPHGGMPAFLSARSDGRCAGQREPIGVPTGTLSRP